MFCFWKQHIKIPKDINVFGEIRIYYVNYFLLNHNLVHHWFRYYFKAKILVPLTLNVPEVSGVCFSPKINCLQHTFWNVCSRHCGRQVGKAGERREFRKGSRHKTCGVKKAVSSSPLEERVSKTSPSHKTVAEVNLFGQEALRYYRKYCQKIYA